MAVESQLLFGQLVIGPAGSGKTTYCKAMSELLTQLNREVIMVNLDPDNDCLPFTPNVDINELVRLEEVMENENLGPNGSFLFCIDLLVKNFDWLCERINQEWTKARERIDQSAREENKNRHRPYIIFDCPGQIELYTNYPNFKQLVSRLTNDKILSKTNSSTQDAGKYFLELRLVTVNIVDSFYASDASKFISVVLNSLISMLHVETPFVGVLSKVDIIENYGKTDFGLDFYCELPDLARLADRISEDPFMAKHKKLTESIASIIENYGLVSYTPLNVKNQENLLRVLGLIDRANGFFISDMSSNEDVLNYYRSIQADFEASKYDNLL